MGVLSSGLTINEDQARRFQETYQSFLTQTGGAKEEVEIQDLKLNTVFDEFCDDLQKFSTVWAWVFISMVFGGLAILALVAVTDKYRKRQKKGVTPVKRSTSATQSNRSPGGAPKSEVSRDSWSNYRN